MKQNRTQANFQRFLTQHSEIDDPVDVFLAFCKEEEYNDDCCDALHGHAEHSSCFNLLGETDKKRKFLNECLRRELQRGSQWYPKKKRNKLIFNKVTFVASESRSLSVYKLPSDCPSCIIRNLDVNDSGFVYDDFFGIMYLPHDSAILNDDLCVILTLAQNNQSKFREIFDSWCSDHFLLSGGDDDVDDDDEDVGALQTDKRSTTFVVSDTLMTDAYCIPKMRDFYSQEDDCKVGVEPQRKRRCFLKAVERDYHSKEEFDRFMSNKIQLRKQQDEKRFYKRAIENKNRQAEDWKREDERHEEDLEDDYIKSCLFKEK